MHAVFSDHAPPETVMRAMLAGACDFLTKPMHDNEIRGIWQHVLRRQLDLDSGAAAAADAETSDVVIREDVKAMKRASGELHGSDEEGSDKEGSDEEGSDGSQQQKQGRTTKKTKFNSSPEQHVMPVKAAKQLRGTKGNASSRYLLINFLVLAYNLVLQ
jgi:two-component response regulator (ARR-B family)